MTTRTDQPPESVAAQNAGHSTTDYSATKAPENRPHVESAFPANDARARPGGAHGAPVQVGMETLCSEAVPTERTESD